MFFSRSLIVVSALLTAVLAVPAGGPAPTCASVWPVQILGFTATTAPNAPGSISFTLDTVPNLALAPIIQCSVVLPVGAPMQNDSTSGEYECPEDNMYLVKYDTKGVLSIGITRHCSA
ncbi:hypothetical protein EXIGLDRAFT_723675 [Exidia glandulosa HHB12029]|uniref:AA1-like domain-containing protein n=1 Tax=Exidia glandulosa HHB12029 TaxID=1314781 RepID=A0A165ERF0_EXIGL|nr:hypothetical protein EXIGLDRAFT_723675 [Exidia glandulosa HHB12029]